MPDSPRIRRLRNDLRAMESLRSESSILDFATPPAQGDCPESYTVRFSGRGLWHDDSGEVAVRERHEVQIRLGASYPRTTPELGWRSPIFHPNISAGGAVCLGGYGTHWTPSLMLDELCKMLWDMIRYENFDVESPYNRQAATWAKVQASFHLPVDPRPIRDLVAGRSPSGVPARRPIVGASVRVDPPRVAAPEPEVLFLADVRETVRQGAQSRDRSSLERAPSTAPEIVSAELVELDEVGAEVASPATPDILFIE